MWCDEGSKSQARHDYFLSGLIRTVSKRFLFIRSGKRVFDADQLGIFIVGEGKCPICTCMICGISPCVA